MHSEYSLIRCNSFSKNMVDNEFGGLTGYLLVNVVCCVGNFKGKTVHTFDVALWIIGYFLFTRLQIIANNIPHNSYSTSQEAVVDTDTFA